jgi:excinuclease ABC subunit A
LIELGPEGGAEGGRVVAAGTPLELAANPRSITGRYVAHELARSERAGAPSTAPGARARRREVAT